MKNLFLEQFKGWRIQEAVWFVFSVSTITALSLWWGDDTLGISAAVTGMAYTILAGKGKIACFLFGMINTPIYACMAFNAGYYGDFALNAYYFLMMFPGLYVWLRNHSSDPEEGIRRTRLSPKSRAILSALIVAFILPAWFILDRIGGSNPLCDAATNVLSIAAMILTIRRAIEEWVLWIAVNAIEIIMWYKAWMNGCGSISILLMWMLFLANGIYLLCLWMRIERKNAAKAAKTALRKRMSSMRKALTPSEREAASKRICEKLIFENRPLSGRTLAVYFASAYEIDLKDFISSALEQGATVVSPRWNGSTYELAKVEGLTADKLRLGPMKIPEPVCENIVRPQDVDIWIVPGLAFTADGKRLGYGGGWYDRLLSRSSASSLKIAVAHPFQIVSDIPTEKHDIRLDRIVSVHAVVSSPSNPNFTANAKKPNFPLVFLHFSLQWDSILALYHYVLLVNALS